jgi:hypothetical protein
MKAARAQLAFNTVGGLAYGERSPKPINKRALADAIAHLQGPAQKKDDCQCANGGTKCPECLEPK